MVGDSSDGEYPRIRYAKSYGTCPACKSLQSLWDICFGNCSKCRAIKEARRHPVNGFFSRLFGLSRDQFSPIIVRAARVGLSVGGSAAIGAILEGLGAVDWSAYLSDSQVPYALLIAGALAMVLEGLADQLKRL